MFYLFNILIQMKILLNNHKLNKELRHFNDVGFVPTMGGIHDGHISLIKKSKKMCNKTIVSIFINPKQFNNKKDFINYPNNLKKDLSILRKIKGLDFVYIPKFNDIYSFRRKSKITIPKKYKILCAKYRNGHFEGVLDVMDRLTMLIKPDKIFMGMKDFQQLFLVKDFIEKKHKTSVIGCKTIRNRNKLALSSRNFLLSKYEIEIAQKVSKKIFLIKNKLKYKKNINKILSQTIYELQKKFKIRIEYLENRNEINLKLSNKTSKSRIFFAYYINDIRLIDNI